jgi:mRNA interferase RelE/StbE
LLQLPQARRQLRQLIKTHNPAATAIIEAIKALADNPYPRGSKKLVGRREWRIRVADYRILYLIEAHSRTVTIAAIAHRREVYK